MVNKWEIDKTVDARKGSEYPKVDRERLSAESRAYLPDRLVERDLTLDDAVAIPAESFDGTYSALNVWIDDELVQSAGTLTRASYADMQKLRDLRVGFTAQEHSSEIPATEESLGTATLHSLLEPRLAERAKGGWEFVSLMNSNQAEEYERVLGRRAAVVRIVTAGGEQNFGADLVDSTEAYQLLLSNSGIKFVGHSFVQEEA
jgi:hypothetical protein